MEYKKRKKYIVNKKLQVWLFLKWLILPLIFISAVIYYFKANVYVLAFAAVFILSLSWRILIISHRFAGPIYRLERDLEDIAKGNFSLRIKFRKNDELKSIAEGINNILDEMERRVKKGG